MKIAGIILGVGLCFAVTACALTETITRQLPAKNRVIIQKDYAGHQQIQELNQFSDYLNGLSKEQCAEEMKVRAAQFETDPSIVNRLKYALTVFYGGEKDNEHQRALSLLDDSVFATASEEAAEFWRFFARHLRAMIVAQMNMNQAKQRLLAERRAVTNENEALKKDLDATHTELARIERQLHELTSIERSILERDIAEDVPKP